MANGGRRHEGMLAVPTEVSEKQAKLHGPIVFADGACAEREFCPQERNVAKNLETAGDPPALYICVAVPR